MFTVAANTGAQRTGTLTIAGRTFRLTQEAPSTPEGPGQCEYTISPLSQSIGPTGGAGTSITVSTAADCAWTAVRNAEWLTIASGSQGNGSGSVDFRVAANTGGQRTGTLTIAGQTFTVTQGAQGQACAYTIAPQSQSIGASGGAGTTVTVTTTAGCEWTAVSNASWLTITSGTPGDGSGSVNFTIAANTGAQRTGTLTIAGRTFTVTQAQACAYTIAPQSQSIGASGGAGTTVTVTAPAGCGWTAVNNVPWLTITSGTPGNGGGSVNFTIGVNTGAQRTGTLTVAGQTFTVTQAQACAYTIAPPSQSIGASGGTGTTVTVTTTAGCGWTAVNNVPWLTITSGTSGNGSGSVNFTIGVNTGGQRTGTLTIAGHTFTVNQACAYSITPQSQSIGAFGGAGTTVTVTTAAGCGWTGVNNVSWLTITSGTSGNGSGSVNFTIGVNTGAQRTGTLTIAGQTFTVTQEAANRAVLPVDAPVRWVRLDRQEHDVGLVRVNCRQQRGLVEQHGRYAGQREWIGRNRGKYGRPADWHAHDRRPDVHGDGGGEST